MDNRRGRIVDLNGMAGMEALHFPFRVYEKDERRDAPVRRGREIILLGGVHWERTKR